RHTPWSCATRPTPRVSVSASNATVEPLQVLRCTRPLRKPGMGVRDRYENPGWAYETATKIVGGTCANLEACAARRSFFCSRAERRHEPARLTPPERGAFLCQHADGTDPR